MKRIRAVELAHALGSPPTRRRGLKLRLGAGAVVRRGSPPTRRRGLKLSFGVFPPFVKNVASHAEAWIETKTHRPHYHAIIVASHAEAWIETSKRWRAKASRSRSPPTRRRGLKLSGANAIQACVRSPPTRRRGLKHVAGMHDRGQHRSPPTRRRGLKQALPSQSAIPPVSRLPRGGVD